MQTLPRLLALFAVGTTTTALLFGGCGGGSSADESASNEAGGSSSKGGSSGKAGSSGKGGSSGTAGAGGGSAGAQAGGASGSAGTQGGSAGAQGGNGGSSGNQAAGASGSAGASGGAGKAGASGASGQAGGSGASGSAGQAAGGSGGQSAGGSGGSGAGAGTGGAGGQVSDGGLDPDAACVADTTEATLKKKPVDIVFVIDNSGSMTGEITAVQKNINQNFADIIGTSGLDYRVIMLSRHGSATSGQSVCISAPLSGTSCMPIPPKPVNTDKFFHYSVEISSHNSFDQVINTYNKVDEFQLAPQGWSAWLRPDAFKVFVEISDDDPDGATYNTAAKFETKLFTLTPAMFGTAEKRNFVWHSIIGLKANTPASAPWPATAPVQAELCGTGAVSAAPEYQKESIATGGLRFPICDNDSFDVVFQQIAKGVVEGTSVECDFPIPPNPPGKVIDPATIEINYTPGNGGPTESLSQVKVKAGCDASSFYIEGGIIHLCPSTCTTVQKDTKAKIQLLFGCGKL